MAREPTIVALPGRATCGCGKPALHAAGSPREPMVELSGAVAPSPGPSAALRGRRIPPAELLRRATPEAVPQPEGCPPAALGGPELCASRAPRTAATAFP
mmetsp:Transcript_18124/g.42066  ORF Transcript_18124/g.42066 Transcript_18124/m.42066 type:complete len:100 (-) Transcript_18124:147-446(-)